MAKKKVPKKEAIKKGKSAISKKFAATRKAIEQQLNLAKKKINAQEKKLKQMIHKNPEKATAIAAGAGVAVGAILGAVAASLKKKK